MKGISLAIETIIVLIIAVTVLTVLLMALNMQGGPVFDRLKLERERTDKCGTYAFKDGGKCDTEPTPELVEICKKLDVKICGIAIDTNIAINCGRECCKLNCMSKPETEIQPT